jgi:glycosyltransferase involved in cell wall biosynthesis
LDLNPVLEIFGVGSQEHYLSSQIERYGLSSRIKLRGLTSSPYAEFESADLMILPSAYEGFGLVLLEALNAGCPVVASRIPAVIEVLGEMYPYLFNPNSKSELEQRVRGIVLSERAWLDDYRDKTLEKFSLEKQFNKTTEIYGLCMNDK